MAITLKYVNVNGRLIEYFIGIRHITSTTDTSLKIVTVNLLASHNINTSRVCGQSYVGATNMLDELNGLKIFILRVNTYIFYSHCFAH